MPAGIALNLPGYAGQSLALSTAAADYVVSKATTGSSAKPYPRTAQFIVPSDGLLISADGGVNYMYVPSGVPFNFTVPDTVASITLKVKAVANTPTLYSVCVE